MGTVNEEAAIEEEEINYALEEGKAEDYIREFFETVKMLSKNPVEIRWYDDAYSLDSLIQNMDNNEDSAESFDDVYNGIKDWLGEADIGEFDRFSDLKELIKILPDDDNISLEMFVENKDN